MRKSIVNQLKSEVNKFQVELEKLVRQINFELIDKKLTKKNAELQEVRETRQKLLDKEKEISASIDKLQNQKIEVIFEQVKKEVESENLKVSSASIIPLLEVLRNSRQIEDDRENEESVTEKVENISKEKEKTGNIFCGLFLKKTI